MGKALHSAIAVHILYFMIELDLFTQNTCLSLQIQLLYLSLTKGTSFSHRFLSHTTERFRQPQKSFSCLHRPWSDKHEAKQSHTSQRNAACDIIELLNTKSDSSPTLAYIFAKCYEIVVLYDFYNP